MKQLSLVRCRSVAWLVLLVPALADAHVGVGHSAGFAQGFGHPFAGLDHVCAMLAVGLWAAQRGGREIWLLPLSFVATMAAGAALGALGVVMPFVEQGIVASVLVLGALVAAALRPPLPASACFVGLLALFHGHAHGAELPASASGLWYGAGFVLATAALHGIGVGLALQVQSLGRSHLVRLSGGGIALCGLYLWLAA